MFITLPRFQHGVPITLGVVSTSYATNLSVVHAYPSYSWQESHGANCDGITSVFRIFVSDKIRYNIEKNIGFLWRESRNLFDLLD